ncbi:1-acyl-sn-glycerol-3-phosphate acyltransferase [Candidatus Nomurabacteria bacterium]|nr:1-acyl-sn-glycerol-3-phosphate acyltransferase [Candidatus Nomurabacteria bacterium]
MKASQGGKPKKRIEYGGKPSYILYSLISLIIRFLAGAYVKASWNVDPAVYDFKGPIIIISNHPSYLDPFLVGAILSKLRANYLAADNYFRNPIFRWLLKRVGAIPKVQFRADPTAMKAMLRVIRRGGVLGIFPEGTRSTDGKQMPVEATFARFIKKMGAHVVAANIKGAYMTWPRWSRSGMRRGRIMIDVRPVLNADDIQGMSQEEVNSVISEALSFNDYEYQRSHPVVFRSKAPAKGLHNILYRCPRCDRMWSMDTNEHELFCTACGNKAIMDDYGFLKPFDDKCVVFDSPDKWNEWQFDRLKPIVMSDDFLVEDHAEMHISVKEAAFTPETKGIIKLYHKQFEFTPDNSEAEPLIFPISGIWGISSDYGVFFDLVGSENTYRFYLENGRKALTFSHALDILRAS